MARLPLANRAKEGSTALENPASLPMYTGDRADVEADIQCGTGPACPPLLSPPLCCRRDPTALLKLPPATSKGVTGSAQGEAAHRFEHVPR